VPRRRLPRPAELASSFSGPYHGPRADVAVVAAFGSAGPGSLGDHSLSDGMSKLDVALSLAERGLAVFPCHSVKDDACTCKEFCASPAKHPVTSKGGSSGGSVPGVEVRRTC
jgi:hypothetical protein